MGLKLSEKERSYLNELKNAVFSNPFSEKRENIDRSLSGISEKASIDDHRAGLIELSRKKITELERSGRVLLSEFNQRDQNVLKYALLFDVYHRCISDFDRHISEQVKSDRILNIPFAAKAIALLERRGFSHETAVHYFAIFFQMRRAFYFIRRQIIGSSNIMRRLRCHLWQNIFTEDLFSYDQLLWARMEDFSTMLLGETGSGKGICASAIGRSAFIPYDEKKMAFSENFATSFISINLSQFPESLIESELFGHKKGAFTGALENRQGIFSLCNKHGAIFLDEIGEISIPVQIKLLKVLQERVFSPVGSTQQLRFSGRVIAATNQPLFKLRADGLFRDDFYYRLCSDLIEVPSLYERIQEDPMELKDLSFHIIDKILGREDEKIREQIYQVLMKDSLKNYNWPGNVRELEQAVRRIILTSDYQPFSCQKGVSLLSDKVASCSLDAKQLLSLYAKELYKKMGTFENTARFLKLDRRTVKKYIEG